MTSSTCSASCAAARCCAAPAAPVPPTSTLAEVVKNVGDAALSLDGNLRTLEINPLWVDGDRIEALDVLVVTDGS